MNSKNFIMLAVVVLIFVGFWKFTDIQKDRAVEEAVAVAKTDKKVEKNPSVAEELDIQYNTQSQTVELVYPDGKTKVIASDSPSNPVKSPDNKRAVYISPLEWEVKGSLYLVDLETERLEELVTPEGEDIPKNVIWLDNENVFVIIGYAYGTISVGGGIYKVNIDTKEKELLDLEVNDDNRLEITDFHIADGALYYEGIRYIDDDLNESEPYLNKIELDSLISD